MLYDYNCDNCSHEMRDVCQSMKDAELITCPSCGKDGLSRVIYGGIGYFVKGVSTIGQLADKNWASMGSYKRSEIEQESKDKAKEETSFFSMTEPQKEKYIMTGEK